MEDHVKIGAMCEVAGIGEGSVIASEWYMASGKKIYDEDTGDLVSPMECKVGDQTFLLPVIPPTVLRSAGRCLPIRKHHTDAVTSNRGFEDSVTMRHLPSKASCIPEHRETLFFNTRRNMTDLILALDQGTTSSRSILFTEKAEIRAVASEPLSAVTRIQVAEQDAEAIWETQRSTIVKVLDQAGIGLSEVSAIGITNQRESTIAWNRETGEALVPRSTGNAGALLGFVMS